MGITGWKFTTKEGLILDEHTNYPDDIIKMAADMELPNNSITYAKVSVYAEDLRGVEFHIRDMSLPIPTEHILSFQPFERVVCDGMTSKEGVGGDLFYRLNNEEFPLKKKNLKSSQDLQILRRLQELNGT